MVIDVAVVCKENPAIGHFVDLRFDPTLIRKVFLKESPVVEDERLFKSVGVPASLGLLVKGARCFPSVAVMAGSSQLCRVESLSGGFFRVSCYFVFGQDWSAFRRALAVTY